MGIVFGILVFVFMMVLIFFAADKNDDKGIIEEKEEEIKVATKSRNKINDIKKEQILQQMERNIFNFFSYEEVLSKVGENNYYKKYEYDEIKEEIVSYSNPILWKYNGKSYYNKEAITPKILYEEEVAKIERIKKEFYKDLEDIPSLFGESLFEKLSRMLRKRDYENYKEPRKYYNGYVIRISVSHEQSLEEAEKKREVYEHMHPEVKRNRLLKEQNELLKMRL